MSVFAIGDLHGCPEELDALLDHLAPAADDTLVLLGDYIDRGPGARPLVERLLRLRTAPCTTVFLRGNHEDMFLDYLGYGGHFGAAFLGNGGVATLASYGIPRDVAGRDAAAMLPPEHLQFMLDLRLTHVCGGFLFVHAGVRPGVPLEEQSEEDMLWIREEFYTRPHALPYTIVFGHTPHREAWIELPYRIGLDTGLVYGNKLSCLDATGRRLLEVKRGGRRVLVRDLGPEFAAAGL
jgi:serine/threonine protein phosphatase 1